MSVVGPLLPLSLPESVSLPCSGRPSLPPSLPSLLHISPSVTFSAPLSHWAGRTFFPSFQFRQPSSSSSPMHFEASFAFRESSQLKLIFKGAAISAARPPAPDRPPKEGWAGLGMRQQQTARPPGSSVNPGEKGLPQCPLLNR